MSTHFSWFNFDHSLNPFEPQEESSQLAQKINQNSIFLLERYSLNQRQQQSRSVFNIQAVIDNLMGKNENLLHKDDIITLQMMNGFNNESIQSDSFAESESQQQEPEKEMQQLENMKGLKNLAKMLIRTLKKRKFDSSKYLSEQIEENLMKGRRLSKNVHLHFMQQFARQSKNIRRRTYDALNVMVAANVLGPDLAIIKRVNSNTFTKKCAMIVGQKNQLQSNISAITQRINHKKQFLKQLRRKKNVLEWWTNKKKLEAQKMTQTRQQLLKIDKRFKIQKNKIKTNKIPLPVVFVGQIGHQEENQIEIKSTNMVRLKSKNKKIKLFSEIDIFQVLKNQQQMQHELLFQTEIERNVDILLVKDEMREQTTEKQEHDENQSP